VGSFTSSRGVSWENKASLAKPQLILLPPTLKCASHQLQFIKRMNTLLQRFTAERKSFTTLRRQAEAKVVRWEYWDWPNWDWDPEHFLELEPERAKKGKANYAYGCDKQNNVVVIHHFKIGNPDKIHGMQFLRYAGNKIVGSNYGAEVIRDQGGKVVGTDFSVGGSLHNVYEATVLNGRIVRVESLRSGGYPSWDWKTIAWQGDKISTVQEGLLGRKAHRQKSYSPVGKLLEDLDLSKPVPRKPLPKGVTMSSLLKEIRARLTDAVIKTVTKAKVKEPVYCLALSYDCEGNPLLLPELGIGLDSERRALLKRGRRDAKREIWDAENNFPLFANNRTALNDKALDRACSLFNRELEYKGSDEPARKLILQVASDLAKIDWKGKLHPTDDFIVYAVDTDGADLHKNLKLTVPPKQLAKLKAAKLL
jgi:hypothetical protein